MVSTCLVTHLHSDHITDLNDLVTSRWVMMPVNVPLRVIGPPGFVRWWTQCCDASPDQQYRHDHHDDLRANGPLTVNVEEVQPGDSFSIGAVSARCMKPITASSPEHWLSVGARRQGGGVAGDTVPCDGVDEMCRNADAYVQTVIRHDLVSALADALPNGGRMRDILNYHSSVEQAAQTAARAGVKNLVLTHYVPPMAPDQQDDWKAHATAHFDGPVILGPDLTSLEL